jgi:hypothetical protein
MNKQTDSRDDEKVGSVWVYNFIFITWNMSNFCRIAGFYFAHKNLIQTSSLFVLAVTARRSWPSPHCGGRAISVAVIAAIIHPTCGLGSSQLFDPWWRNYMRLSTNLICQWTWAHWWVWWELLVIYAFCLHYLKSCKPIHGAKNGLTKLKKHHSEPSFYFHLDQKWAKVLKTP